MHTDGTEDENSRSGRSSRATAAEMGAVLRACKGRSRAIADPSVSIAGCRCALQFLTPGKNVTNRATRSAPAASGLQTSSATRPARKRSDARFGRWGFGIRPTVGSAQLTRADAGATTPPKSGEVFFLDSWGLLARLHFLGARLGWAGSQQIQHPESFLTSCSVGMLRSSERVESFQAPSGPTIAVCR